MDLALKSALQDCILGMVTKPHYILGIRIAETCKSGEIRPAINRMDGPKRRIAKREIGYEYVVGVH